MDINTSSNLNFCAKFFDSPHLRDIVNDSIVKGKFDKINQARKNISMQDLRIRLKVDLCYTDDKPTIIFSRYLPKKNVLVPKTADDYEITAITEYTSSKKNESILKFARRMLSKLGNNAPNNNMYKKVVQEKVHGFKAPKYDVYC